jgi:NDP-sugar pyrophosphorylase family protein
MRAMILAAGLGTRAGSLTADRAKPTLTVLDEPVVLGLARRLAAQGVRELVVNTHAHPETVRDALRDAPLAISFSHEPVLRGTGGAILAARDSLEGDGPFLVINGDMLLDLDVAALVEAHRGHRAVATLLLRNDPRAERFGTLGYDRGGRVTRVTDLISVAPEEGRGLFAGVHVLEPGIYDHMPRELKFDIVQDVYIPLLRRGERLGTLLHPATARWWPIGTPADLLQANLGALSEQTGAGEEPSAKVRAAPSARVRGEIIGPAWVGANAEIHSGARVGPFAIVGARACIEAEARLERVLVLSDARVERGAVVHDAVVGLGGVNACD